MTCPPFTVLSTPVTPFHPFSCTRYPYVSCEIFCCEIQDILHTLVESDDSKLLKKLFSLLDLSVSINTYLGGYFEKVLEMLFRRMTVAVIPLVNDGGVALLRRFLGKIDNYSVMQIVQRLMLPHIPFMMQNDTDEVLVDDRQNYLCNWSSIPEACELLLDRMLSQHPGDVPSHVSDLLITVLQLSPPDASILYHLCIVSCLEKLLAGAFADNADHGDVEALPSAAAAVSLAALSVLEPLVSRICEAAAPSGAEDGGTHDDGGAAAADDSDGQIMVQIQASIANICEALTPSLPAFRSQLKHFVNSANYPCGEVATQTKWKLPRLSHRGLLMVKLIESLVRLGNTEIDQQLLDSDILVASLDLVFTFRFNSLLHLTVQKIVIMIIEGGTVRRQMQRSILFTSGFLSKAMQELRADTLSSVENNESTGSDDRDPQLTKLLAGARCPLLGHLIQITQAISNTMHVEEQMTLLDEGDDDGGPDLSATSPGDMLSPASSSSSLGTATSSVAGAGSSSGKDEALLGDDTSAAPASAPSSATAVKRRGEVPDGLKALIAEYSFTEAWDSFFNDVLKDIIVNQSSFQVNVDRTDDEFGLLTLSDQLEGGAGTSSSFEAFGLSARQNQQLHGHGNVGNNPTISSNWRHRNQLVVGSGDESGQHFSFDNVDDDDDDDYDGGTYGSAQIINPGAVPNFANFDEASFSGSFDFGFNADGSKVEHFADFSSAGAFTAVTPTAGHAAAESSSSSSSSSSSATDIFATFDTGGHFDSLPASRPTVTSASGGVDIFAEFSSGSTFDDIVAPDSSSATTVGTAGPKTPASGI